MTCTASLIAAAMCFLPQSQSTSVEDLAFLTGSWRGEVGPMVFEETWLSPMAGNMTGVFRMSNAGEVELLEILSLNKAGEGVSFQLRHFSSALELWPSELDGPMEATVELVDEDSVRFVMVEKDTGVEAITYDREGDTMKAAVVFTAEGREPFSLVFKLVK